MLKGSHTASPFFLDQSHSLMLPPSECASEKTKHSCNSALSFFACSPNTPTPVVIDRAKRLINLDNCAHNLYLLSPVSKFHIAPRPAKQTRDTRCAHESGGAVRQKTERSRLGESKKLFFFSEQLFRSHLLTKGDKPPRDLQHH